LEERGVGLAKGKGACLSKNEKTKKLSREVKCHAGRDAGGGGSGKKKRKEPYSGRL